MARPTKLTHEVQERIVRVLKGGGTRTAAYTAAGIVESTFHLWMARGDAAKRGKFSEFSEAVRRAEQHAVTRNVTVINQLAAGGLVTESTTLTRPDGSVVYREKKSLPSFQAASWWLERRHWQDWARRDTIEHRMPDGPMYASQIAQQNNFIVIEDRAGARRAAAAVNHNGNRVLELEAPEELDDMSDPEDPEDPT